MKKSIIIIGALLIALGITAFSVINSNTSEKEALESLQNKEVAINTSAKEKMKKPIFEDFIYDVGPRFSPIRKDVVHNATTIYDFIDRENLQWMKALKSVNIIIIKNERQTEIQALGHTEELTEDQLKILRDTDYSSHFNIRVEFQEINKKTGLFEDRFDSPHLTIVPEKQAEYINGKDAFMSYLKEESAFVRSSVIPEKLQPAKLYFIVTKSGAIENVRLDRTSNYPLVDDKMIKLINEAPGTWKPAENFKGEKMDQELVVSFGLMGC